MDDLMNDFLTESHEGLDQLDQDFVALEKDPRASERLASIFRTIHTLKGTSGCLGLSKLESVAHVGENLLSLLREAKLVINAEITTALLKLVDAVREMLGSIETQGNEGDGDYTKLIALLTALANPTPTASVNAEPAVVPAVVAEASPIQTERAELTLPSEVASPETAQVASAEDEPSADVHAKGAHADGERSSGIRVDVGLLDRLMTLVGELVLARNQVLQFTATQKDSAFLGTTQRLNLITTELQEGVMKTRMQPIGNVWNKFPRIVRDIATICGKKVRIEMEGRETELDKTIIEAIKDPLTHVVRNSVDHGIELPEKRVAKGKSEDGCLHMRAFHEGGQVNIEISDDGGGIDAERVKKKALEKGLISPEHAARMSEREAINLVFLPGFSTAEKISNISGRGVGMDVVKTNIEKIGGTVDIQTRLGQGTTLRIKIPLTLAIIPALVVTSGGERFAIPQVSLIELMRIEAGGSAIEFVHGTPVYRLRGNLLPLVYLNKQLQLSDAKAGDASSNIVVLRCGDRQFGLVVDQVNDTEEIVVKPLAKQLKGINVFAGTTIMGDGRVALILDATGLAHAAHVVSHGGSSGRDQAAATTPKGEAAGKHALLMFQLAHGQRMAMPLSMVARLEEFSKTAIEEAGGRQMVQYRGQIMPLIDVADLLNGRSRAATARRRKPPGAEKESVQVIVHSQNGQTVGLIVERIMDVVEEHVSLQQATKRPGIWGTAVLKEQITEMLDVEEVVALGSASAAHSAVDA